MCEVCIAGELLKINGQKYSKSERDGALTIRSRAASKAAEFEPYVIEIKRGDNEPIWFAGDDLSGVVGKMGLDIKWEGVNQNVKDWLLGGDDGQFIEWMNAGGHRSVTRDEAMMLGLEMRDEPLMDYEIDEAEPGYAAGVAGITTVKIRKRKSRKDQRVKEKTSAKS